MNKKPQYLVIGDGRWANHLKFYLLHQELSYLSWSRGAEARGGPNLAELLGHLEPGDKVLVAISDGALAGFYRDYLRDFTGDVVHFSGALTHPQMVGLHPLASFHQELFSPEFYHNILFVTEIGRKGFKDIFPTLPNPSVAIDPEQKPLYHALCSLTANLSQFLWAECYENLHTRFGISERELGPFLQSTFENLMRNPKAITGPLVRGDFQTVHEHENSLEGHLLHGLYRSFVHTFLRSRHSMEVTGEDSSRFFEI
jgi:hypothetical protein